MSRPFHLAVPAGDLKDSVHFYEKILECKLGNREEGKWIDVDFWGNELTLHKTNMKLPSERHEVDMGSVPVPHFGVHLEPKIFEKIKENLKKNNIEYLDQPYTVSKIKKNNKKLFLLRTHTGMF